MSERPNAVTVKGNAFTLVGDDLKTGDKAPDFQVVANDLSPVSFSAYAGKVIVVYSVPSLDTPVCDTTTRRFNEEAVKLGADVTVLTISMDLPFAQARWCGAAGVENVVTLSDHRDADFGEKYGVLIKELRLLARAVFVVDRNGVIQYIETLKEASDEPDFDGVLDAVKKLT